MNSPDQQAVSAAICSDSQACYRALVSHDSRFDGRFFVGVRTTHIYCRPVCRVRVPRAQNCRFYPTAAAAELAGFRPCLRCRPEMAPGWSSVDIGGRLARAAAHLIETRLHCGDRLDVIAERLGVSDRHLRRLFEAHFGVRPIDYMQTQRLLLAKRLLTDTGLPVIDVAGAAGFGSLRRLNASMKSRYRMTPTQLRGQYRQTSEAAQFESAKSGGSPGPMQFKLSVREPYDFSGMCTFFGSRSLKGLEVVTDNSYARVLSIAGPQSLLTGWIRLSSVDRPVAAGRPVLTKTKEAGNLTLQLEVSASLAPVIAAVLAQVRHLFDLDSDPQDFLPVLGKLAVANPGIRVPGAVSGFEIAVRAVLGQQITVKAARTLAARFVARFGAQCQFGADSDFDGALTHAFPDPGKVSRARINSIAELGIINRRAQTIKALASACARDQLDLSPGAPLEETLQRLNAQPGIGDWTAQYIAMRALRWPDAFIAADYGVMKALGVKSASQARDAVQQWRPWRSYAVMHLWSTLHQENAT